MTTTRAPSPPDLSPKVAWSWRVLGPVILVATMSGDTLAATTGLAAGVLLLGTAAAGFHDLANVRRQQLSTTAPTSPPPTGA